MKKLILLFSLLFIALIGNSQEYLDLIAEGTHTVQYISQRAEAHFDEVGRDRGTGYKPFRRWQYFAERAMDENGMLKSPEFYYNELQNYNALQNSESLFLRTTVGTWEEMGPTYWNATSGYNPGVGRITSIAVDESNLDHIIVGSPTGGVWKSLDGGNTWTGLTDNLANIDVYALAIDPLNSSTYYWGSTGGTIFKSTDGGATWTLHGDVSNGNVNRILIDPTNTSKLYASAQGGGLFKSLDGGSTWTSINSSATTGYDFQFKPGDPTTVYASGTRFYVSTDGGATFDTSDGLDAWMQEYVSGTNSWTTSDSNQNGSITPRTGDSMAFLNINNYTFPTTRLISPSLDLSGATNPTLNFSYSQVNWVGNIDQLKVYYKTSVSSNWVQLAHYTAEAAQWTDITLNLPNVTSDYFIAFEGIANWSRGLTLDDVSVEATNLGIVFSDGFESASNDFSSGVKMIGVSADDPSVVYVVEADGGTFGGIHKSTDSGATFTQLSHPFQNYFGYDSNGFDNLGQAPRDMAITVNPNDVNDVHIAGINTWRSTNGGVSFSISSQWTPGGASNENIGYCHADVDIMQFVGTGANAKLFVGSDGGIFKADDPTTVDASYYTDLTPGLGIRQFYRIGISQTDPVIVTGGSQDNGSSVLRADGNWYDWWGADGMEGFIDKNNTQIIYGTSQYGSFVKSTNGGNSVISVGQPDGKGGQNNWNWVVPFEQDPITQNTIYCAFDQVYKSVDGGSNWTSISQNFGDDIDELKIAPSDNNKMYLAIDGALWYTTNGGLIWSPSGLNLSSGRINSIAVHPSDPDKIAAATTNSNKVYISTNGGLTFTPIPWDLPNFSSQAVAWQDNGEDGLYVGMNYGIYYTDNDLGNTWIPFNNGLPNVRINELEINSTDNKLYAATYGRGLWRSNLYDASLSIAEFDSDDFSIYPNPANNEVNIKWTKPEMVTLRIYNSLGKIMFYAKNLEVFRGHKIDVSNFEKGIYFVKLNSDYGEVTKKLVLD
ncbi:VPS10 domain-containing protein [Winogradskyella vincentii]|uniref:T9SS type A sorting domain-containing protein n=1 Tax=Winogradskyella vincentii TaxID=2877122 RepID=A0ABS7Y1J1_9FLAO|nr:T9SS type A sorting domain-containing protein [Winogradskyella vincentii]MCA0153803.1 T9SS type A sorting domain-containing protein [Winogradskyella vincentii]